MPRGISSVATHWLSSIASPTRWMASRSRATASTPSCSQRGASSRSAKWRRPADGPTVLATAGAVSMNPRRRPALDLAFAYRAARDVCQTSDNACLAAVDQAWRPRLAQSLAAVTGQIEAAGTGAPGTIRCAQGLLLAALGRADEAKASFRAALLTPDRALSHHLAREGMGDIF